MHILTKSIFIPASLAGIILLIYIDFSVILRYTDRALQWNISFRTCVTEIGNQVCWSDSLAYVYLPKSVTTLGCEAFRGYVMNPPVIYCEAEETPEGWNSEWDYYVNDVRFGQSKDDLPA